LSLLPLPIGWTYASLDELCIWGSGGTPSRSIPSYFGGGIPWVTISDLNDGVVAHTAETISQSGLENSSAKMVPEGAIMVALYGSIGKLGIAGQPLTTNQAIAYSIPNNKAYDARFLFYVLHGHREQLNKLGSGITQKNIYLGNLKSFNIPIAPRIEQTRIVEKLEELLSDLDAGVAELKAAQKKLVQYRQSLLKAAVEGALTAEWRKTHQPQEAGAQLLERILKERRARWEAKQLAKFQEQGKAPPKGWQDKYPEPVKPDTSELPELPEGWVWASAEQICDFITKGTTPTKGMNGDSEKTIPFLRVTNLTATGTLDMSDKVFVSENTHNGFLARSKVYPGDVLMNIVGPPLGQVSVVPSLFSEWNINQAIAIFRALEGVLPEFICVCLLSPIAQHWLQHRSKTTAGQTNLTLEVCRSLPIPLPPKSEQRELVKLNDTGVGSIYEQINAIQISLKKSAAQRQNILRAAFSGQLVPQDPNDEPASVLLERIQAERRMLTVSKKSLNGKRKG
jgi:type I restriction enzyme S subunit